MIKKQTLFLCLQCFSPQILFFFLFLHFFFPDVLSLSFFCPQEDTEPWYSQKVYSRYWKHYDLAMRWMRRHQKAYRKAMESFYHLPWHPSAASPRGRYSDWDGNDLPHTHNYSSSYSPHGRAQYHGGAQQYTDTHQGREDADGDSEMEEDSESEGEIEYDLSNMEITEELRQFFAQTERHREELRKYMLVLCFLVFGGHNIERWMASTFTGFVTIHRNRYCK